MADLKTVIGLLYRADWTRLSLAATVRSERDGDLARRRLDAVWPAWFRPGPAGEDVSGEEQGGYHTGRAALLIAPGRRYRLEYLDDRAGDTEGSDGEDGWTQWCPGQAPPWQSRPEASDEPPFPELLRPAVLLSGFTLDVRGPVTACGREG